MTSALAQELGRDELPRPNSDSESDAVADVWAKALQPDHSRSK